MMKRFDGLSGFAREFGFSRQRAWQIMKKKQGLCQVCGKPLFSAVYCKKHTLAIRLRNRKRTGSQDQKLSGLGRPTIESRQR